MPGTLRPAEDADVSAMAAIRAQQWGDKTFWTDRITWYLRGEAKKSLRRWLAAEALLDRSALGADPSACYLHGGDQTCAKQQETGRLRCHLSDLASDLASRKVGVV